MSSNSGDANLSSLKLTPESDSACPAASGLSAPATSPSKLSVDSKPDSHENVPSNQDSASRKSSSPQKHGDSSRASIFEAIVDDHPYFTMQSWKQVENHTQTALAERGFSSAVEAAKDRNGKPVIIIRTMPEVTALDAGPLRSAVVKKLYDHGLDYAIQIEFESFVRAPRDSASTIAQARISEQLNANILSCDQTASIVPHGPSASNMPSALINNSLTHSDGQLAKMGSIRIKNPGKSVKHLTCYYWLTHGKCKKSDDECLYSHYDTGKYAEQPRPLVPGAPAVAGLNAKRIESMVHDYRRAHTGAYPLSANALGIPDQNNHLHLRSASQSQPAMTLMDPDGGMIQFPVQSDTPMQMQALPQFPAYASSQAPLLPTPLSPIFSEKRTTSNPNFQFAASTDGSRTARSTPERRLTVGAGRPPANVLGSGNATPTPKRQVNLSIDTNISNAGFPFLGVPATASTGTFRSFSSPFSAPMTGAFQATPLTTPGSGHHHHHASSLLYSSNNTLAASRELSKGLDRGVKNWTLINQQLVTVWRKFPQLVTQLQPMFDTIQTSMHDSLESRDTARLHMHGDPWYGYVFGHGTDMGSMTYPPNN